LLELAPPLPDCHPDKPCPFDEKSLEKSSVLNGGEEFLEEELVFFAGVLDC
jgi:hypothetical protein